MLFFTSYGKYPSKFIFKHGVSGYKKPYILHIGKITPDTLVQGTETPENIPPLKRGQGGGF
jgi:hypothetical protein